MLPEWQPYIEDLASGETTIDLIAFNRDQLIELGVQEENISIDPVDTVTSDDYFSHYRSVRTGELEGRFATVLALKKF
jgi:copper oxidase (laccase) domain-containing protein